MAGVTNETYKASYAGRGDTGPYPITFSVILDDGGNASDIVVKLLDTAGAETDITSTSTVSGMNVYTAASYAATYTVVLIRYPALTQPYDFGGITRFPVRLIQAAYNRLCYVIQRLALQSDQSFRVPLSEAAPAREPSKLSRASKWRAFDGNGDPIAVAGAAGAFPVTDFMATVLDDTTAAAAIATLGNGSIAGFLTALGMSAYVQTLIDDTDAATARTTLGVSHKGYMNLSFSTLGTGKPNLLGSVEVNGTLVTFGATTPSGSPASPSNNWIYVTAAGAISFDAANAPAWDTAKGGWYYTTLRAVAWVRVDSSGNYRYHHFLFNGQGPEIIFEDKIDIGDWNMDTATDVSVNHYLTYANICGVRVLLRADAGTYMLRELPRSNEFKDGVGLNGTEVDAEMLQVTDTIVQVGRRTGGIFDADANWDATSYNRGWITIRHKEL